MALSARLNRLLGSHRRIVTCSTCRRSSIARQHPQLRKQQRRAGSTLPALQGAGESRPPAPWAMTFDLRERETEWTEANQARLVGFAAAQELGVPWAEMQARLDALAALLPDIGGRIASLRPQLVAPLVRDLDQLPGMYESGPIVAGSCQSSWRARAHASRILTDPPPP